MMDPVRQEVIALAHTVVVKVGTNVLTGADGTLAPNRLQALADWIVSDDNPYFARVLVNRVWADLMGRGLVEPNDDFRASNPPSNAPLLAALAQDLVEHNYDLRSLIRTIRGAGYQFTP